MASISRLVPVAVKAVWPMEASSFTPWLLANPTVLGELLGLDLDLTTAEHKVGGFSLDLIGRDAATDEIVIIENQFGPTDHRHLGQLLTYAGGTEPAVVVWIAESFRDEHRAALDWLNQRTDSNTRFFGVRLAAVTIEGAPPGLVAPLLDLVVRPNDWGKAVKQSTTPAEPSRAPLYEAFWSAWLGDVKALGWTNAKAPRVHWVYMTTGSPAARYVASFRSDGLLSELFFHHQDPSINQQRWAILEAQRPQIEATFGGALDFDQLPNRKGCRIGIFDRGGQTVEDSPDQLLQYRAWFTDTQQRLRSAVAVAGGIPAMPPTAVAVEDLDDES